MRGALTLLFLIFAYNFLLWYITHFGFSPIPLFPEDAYNVVLVTAYNCVLYISWLFGERHRAVQWIGYLFFFQIVALSTYFGDLEIIVRDLPPVILTFAIVVLFESPTEKRISEIEKEREKLLRDIDRVLKERERVEVHLRLLQQEIEKIQSEKEKEESEERLEELQNRLEALQSELKEYKEKESKLLETNRKLFQLLETVGSSEDIAPSKGEVASLRRERKKLIRELVQLQELVDMYSDENERLKEENEKLRSKLGTLEVKAGTMEIELETLRKGGRREEEVLGEVLGYITDLLITEKALQELNALSHDKKRLFIRELIRFSDRAGKERLEPLATVRDIYKLKFSGGRIYLRRRGDRWEVVGILDSENDKDKDRYIRNVLSKIDT